MPPPAFIRQQIAAELEIERHNRPVLAPPIVPRMTLDEAWEDWLALERAMSEAREKFAVALKESAERKAESAYRHAKKILVTATPDRLAELKKQAEEMEKKYGKGTAIRVRNPASPETNEGTGGAQRGAEKLAGEGTHARTGGDEGGSLDPGEPRDPG
jgi:hypothetical protein